MNKFYLKTQCNTAIVTLSTFPAKSIGSYWISNFWRAIEELVNNDSSIIETVFDLNTVYDSVITHAIFAAAAWLIQNKGTEGIEHMLDTLLIDNTVVDEYGVPIAEWTAPEFYGDERTTLISAGVKLRKQLDL